MYYRGYIGTFGWLDTKLPMWFIHFSYLIIVFIAIADKSKVTKINTGHKLIIFASLVITISLVLLSQHLTWDCVGGDVIVTVQGRYFIPAFPLLFILFYNRRFNYPKLIVPVVIIFSVGSLSLTIYTLYTRYYVMPSLESVTIKCDAENTTKDNFYITNLPTIFLEHANTQTREKSRSGSHSAKLTPTNQYGFTYRLYNCGPGDVINFDAWRFGKEGGTVIAASPNGFFISESKPIEKDDKGWEHIQMTYKVQQNMNNMEILIFLFYTGKDSTYFDDVSISYRKFHENSP